MDQISSKKQEEGKKWKISNGNLTTMKQLKAELILTDNLWIYLLNSIKSKNCISLINNKTKVEPSPIKNKVPLLFFVWSQQTFLFVSQQESDRNPLEARLCLGEPWDQPPPFNDPSSLFCPQPVSRLSLIFLWCAFGVQNVRSRAICSTFNNAGLWLMWGTPLLHQHSSSPSSSYLFVPIPLLLGTISSSHTHEHTDHKGCVCVSVLLWNYAHLSSSESLGFNLVLTCAKIRIQAHANMFFIFIAILPEKTRYESVLCFIHRFFYSINM